jgi:hypothetical protein
MPASGTLYWLAVFALVNTTPQKRPLVLSFVLTGAVLPVGMFLTRLAGGNLFAKSEAFGSLGGILAAVQIFYWPVIIVVFRHATDWTPFTMVVLFGSLSARRVALSQPGLRMSGAFHGRRRHAGGTGGAGSAVSLHVGHRRRVLCRIRGVVLAGVAATLGGQLSRVPTITAQLAVGTQGGIASVIRRSRQASQA